MVNSSSENKQSDYSEFEIPAPIKKSRRPISRIIYFFPFQLLLVHIKHNFLLLFLWFLLFGFLLGWIGTKYGMNYLFLYPEYLGTVNFWSFAILGFSLGGFISAFNIYSYIKNGPDFPFIATLLRPFHKYSINNFILPAVYILVLIVKSVEFQYNNELVPVAIIFLNISGLVSGMLLFLCLSLLYFFRLNKNLYKISGKSNEYFDDLDKKNPTDNPSPRAKKWYRRMRKKQMSHSGWRVDTYIGKSFKLKLARDSKHYDNELLKKVFLQNHLNASIFEITLFISFLMLGIFREISFFIIPAGASVILLCTMILMLLSAFRSWFRGWTIPILFFIFLLFNLISSQFNISSFRNYAYGLDYSKQPAEYSIQALKDASLNTDQYEKDLTRGRNTLNNWLTNTGEERPYLIVTNSSGGGLRSALWNFEIFSYLDSITAFDFYKKVQFSTGASGGMIGCAYYRELYLRSLTNQIHPDSISEQGHNICKDLLNPVALSIATNDFFVRLKTCTDGKYIYRKDRGYTFENQLNLNTDFLMDKRLSDYQGPEQLGKIPVMLFSPTINNDSRRMLISSQPISYMCRPFNCGTYRGSIEDIDFCQLLRKHDPLNLKFTSAIRMNATFPYILPQVCLPTTPEINLMDAGIRDNIGIKSTIKYIDAFADWIQENTKGVIIIQIRDTKRHFKLIEPTNTNLASRISAPLRTFYGNFTKVHDYNNDQLLEHFIADSKFPIQVISFELTKEGNEQASLSFHLTELEKKQIQREINSKMNKEQFNLLLNLLQE